MATTWCDECTDSLHAVYATVPRRRRAEMGLDWHRNMKRVGSWCWTCKAFTPSG